MFGIGTGEILLILVIAMLVVGPEKMVEFAGKAGRFIARFRAQSDSIAHEFREALGVDAIKQEMQQTAGVFREVQEDLTSVGQAVNEVAHPLPTVTPLTSSSGSAGALSPGVRTMRVPREWDAAPPSAPVVPQPEAEMRPATADLADDAEGVEVGVGVMVPEDEDVEAISLGEPRLVSDEEADADLGAGTR